MSIKKLEKQLKWLHNMSEQITLGKRTTNGVVIGRNTKVNALVNWRKK